MDSSLDHLLTEGQMIERYGEFFSRGAGRLIDVTRIPKTLQPLIPYAKFWGEPDDEYRSEMIADAPAHILENVAKALRAFVPALEKWLVQSQLDSTSPEYMAFSNLLMVFHDPRISQAHDL